MKRLFLTTAFAILFVAEIYSQGIPQTINYQGVLKDASGVVVPNGDYAITFNLYDVLAGGSSLWNETKTINVVGGIVNTQLGSVTPIPSAAFVAATWLGITIGSGTELTPRITLTSVPYSFISMNVPDGSITALKIADAQVVKSLNGLKDNVNLVAGSNVTITPSGNNITISSTGGGSGIGGTGTANYLPIFTNSTTLGNSELMQDVSSNVGIGTTVPNEKLDVYGDVEFGTTNHPIKLKNQITALGNWGYSLLINNNERFCVDRLGDVNIYRNLGIGTTNPIYPLHVNSHTLHAGYFSSDSLDFNTHVVHSEFTGIGGTDVVGVYGRSVPQDYYGIGGYFIGGYEGVLGMVEAAGNGEYYGVYGSVAGGNGFNYGVYGIAQYGTYSYGVYGLALYGTNNYAGYFSGNVHVTGTLSKGGGSFKIDHPLDPTNKYLYHSFVESPDMMNIYNGNVVTDASGYATVSMPDWFEALNKEFRYQLTVIGDFAQAIISQELQNNQFVIRTDKPNVKVSWQITGIRHDKFAEKYRIPVEENKTGKEVGKYLHPDVYGVDETLGVDYENNKADREKK